ncbi:bcl-2-related ovarian killer protein isoform X1 [Castor canadensis]|uniref:Bcl-2-related ovarian killer protein isoform X1 n=1 Tax=Castor canadensis TaxID=51338 RepID=A0AC58MG38_CASCN
MEVLRRSSVFAAEIMDAFDRSPTDKELVAQAKALGREYVHARLLRAGLAWSAPERAAPAPGGRLAEVCAVLLRLGDELEQIRPSVYRNVARQLHISLQSEPVVTDAFLAVAGHIFSAGGPSQSWLPGGPWSGEDSSGGPGFFLNCPAVLTACSRGTYKPGMDAPLNWSPDFVVQHQGITWGKVVSLYAVAAGLAVDCVRQAQPAMVHALVDCLGEFVRKTLATWLRRRGGWTDVLKCVVSTDPGLRSHWLVAAICSFGRFLKAAFFLLLPER